MSGKVRQPRCKVCWKSDGLWSAAHYLAAQSSDGGHTVSWVTICHAHRGGWNDGGDWQAPVYPLGSVEF